jgi:hypothetical protein
MDADRIDIVLREGQTMAQPTSRRHITHQHDRRLTRPD